MWLIIIDHKWISKYEILRLFNKEQESEIMQTVEIKMD